MWVVFFSTMSLSSRCPGNELGDRSVRALQEIKLAWRVNRIRPPKHSNGFLFSARCDRLLQAGMDGPACNIHLTGPPREKILVYLLYEAQSLCKNHLGAAGTKQGRALARPCA